MSGWPAIDDPELLERLGLDDEQFVAHVTSVLTAVPPRAYEESALALALAYPWARPDGSYELAGGEVAPLREMTPADRDRVVERYTSTEERRPILAIGSNGAPEALERKLAHFPDAEDRAVLALTGRLRDFDIGFAAQPALYGSMPATVFPSPGTAVCATVLWVTPTQFTQLTWSELSYRLGMLRARFEVDESDTALEEVLVFVSRFGAFCVDGEPVALAAIPASGRTARALTQEQALDAAAALAIGPQAKAEALVRAIFEELSEIAPRFAETVNRAGRPFAAEGWTPFPAPRSNRRT